MAEFLNADFMDVVDDDVFVLIIDEFVAEDSFALVSPEGNSKQILLHTI